MAYSVRNRSGEAKFPNFSKFSCQAHSAASRMHSSKIWRRTNRLSVVLSEALSAVVLFCSAPTAIEQDRCAQSQWKDAGTPHSILDD